MRDKILDYRWPNWTMSGGLARGTEHLIVLRLCPGTVLCLDRLSHAVAQPRPSMYVFPSYNINEHEQHWLEDESFAPYSKYHNSNPLCASFFVIPSIYTRGHVVELQIVGRGGSSIVAQQKREWVELGRA